MFKAPNGFTLKDASTKWGWDIKSGNDVVMALIGMEPFATVASDFIVDAIRESMKDRMVYEDIYDLAEHILTHYI